MSDSKTTLIVGLGNPGTKYELTRHNIGFLIIDHFLKFLTNNPEVNITSETYKDEKKALIAKAQYKNQTLILAKPQTFMNLSGESVQALMTFYKIKKENILVIQDDLDLPYGAIRFFYNRSPGGHNGIKNIHEKIGSEYSRLKIGIRADMGQIPVDRFVLMNFDPEEQKKLDELFQYTNQSIMGFIDLGHNQASNKFNKKSGFFSEEK